MTTERRLSAHTDSNYARDIAALIKFCDQHQLQEWAALDSQHVRTFAAHSHAKGLGPRSIQRRLSAVRAFFEFLVRKGFRRSSVYDVRAPKAQRRLPETLDPDQMARLLEIPAGDVLVARDRAIMELLYSSGLRLAELVGLDLDGLDLKDRTVRVKGKGDKERIVPVGTEAAKALAKWLKERASVAKPDELALFVARGGRR